jgi:hypothetical protein
MREYPPIHSNPGKAERPREEMDRRCLKFTPIEW